MELGLNLFVHLLLVGSLAAFLFVVVKSALAETDTTERVLRLMAMFAGALVALGANVSGLSYAEFTVGALAGSRAPSTAAAALASIIPALLGAGLGFFMVRTFRRSTRKGRRLVGFLAVLASVAFANIYAQLTQAKGLLLGTAALPNISFVAGVMLTIVFTWDPDEQGGVGLVDALKVLAQRRTQRPTNPAAFRDDYSDF